MATGIANAIIYVRGIESFSRTIPAALSRTQASIAKFETTRNKAANATNKANARLDKLWEKSASLDSSASSKMGELIAKSNKFSSAKADINEKITKLSTPTRGITGIDKSKLDDITRRVDILNEKIRQTKDNWDTKLSKKYSNDVARLEQQREAKTNSIKEQFDKRAKQRVSAYSALIDKDGRDAVKFEKDRIRLTSQREKIERDIAKLTTHQTATKKDPYRIGSQKPLSENQKFRLSQLQSKLNQNKLSYAQLDLAENNAKKVGASKSDKIYNEAKSSQANLDKALARSNLAYQNKINALVEKKNQSEITNQNKLRQLESQRMSLINKKSEIVTRNPIGAPSAKDSAEIEKLKTKLAEIENKEKAINDKIKEGNDLYNKRKSEIDSQILKTQEEREVAREALREQNTMIDRLGKAEKFQAIGARFAEIQSQLSSFGLVSSSLVTLPILAIGKASIEAYRQFDASMRNIQSIGQITDQAIKNLGDRFLEMSRNIGQTVSSPAQLAESYYEIQSAAFYGEDAMKILKASTKAASAGLADQTATAKATAMALHAYGASADSAGYFTDVMMRAVDIGIFRFEDLTQQMGDFIAAAGMMGIPIEEVMAALTAMTKKGIPIAEAATSLNRVMMNYLKPAKKEVELAREYGIELSANTLKTMGLAGAMEDLMNKTGGNEDVLANLFGEVRSIRGVFALGSDSMQMFSSDLQQLLKSAGSVDRVFAAQSKSLDFKLKNLRNNIQATAISFGSALAPQVMSVLDAINPVIAAIGQFDDKTKSNIVSVAKLLASIGPLSLAFGALAGILGKVSMAWAGIQLGGLALAGGIASLVAIIAGAVLAIGAIIAVIALYEKAQKEAERQEFLQHIRDTGEAFADNASAMRNMMDAYKEYESIAAGGTGATQSEQWAAIQNVKQDRAASQNQVVTLQNNIKSENEYRIKQMLKSVSDLKRIRDEINSVNYIPIDLGVDENMREEFNKRAGSDLDPKIEALEAEIKRLEEINKFVSDGKDEFYKIVEDYYMAAAQDVGNAQAIQKLIAFQEGWKKLQQEFNPSFVIDPSAAGGITTVADRYNSELEKMIAKWQELKAASSDKLLFDISDFALLNGPEVIKSMDDYIAKLEKVAGVKRELLEPFKQKRDESQQNYQFAFAQVFESMKNSDYADVIRIIKENTVGADASTNDFIASLGKLDPQLQAIIKQILNTRDGIMLLRNEEKSPIEILVQFKEDGFNKIQDMINGLAGKVNIDKAMSFGDKTQAGYDYLLQDMQIRGIDPSGKKGQFMIAEYFIKAQASADLLTGSVKKLGSSVSSAGDKFSDATSKIQGFLGAGSGFSKGLGNLLPGGENGILGPGGNGAFEALYRIQDIAMSKTRGKGADTDKWMAMYGLNPDTAAEIVKKFQMGIFDADVMKYVDSEALINTAKLEMIAEQSQKALAEKLAKESGLSKDVFLGMFGMNQKDKSGNTILPSIDVNGIRTKIANDFAALPNDPSTARNLLGVKKENLDTVADEGIKLFAGSFSTAKDNNAEELKKKGEELWDKVGEGVINKASSDTRFKSAVYKMVVEALANG